MNASRSRYWVLLGSLTLSGLLAGALIASVAVRSVAERQLGDAEFLRKRLEQLDGQSPAAAAQPALVRVALAQQKKIQPQRSIVGRLIEIKKATVASEVTGRITQMPVEEGTAVMEGETLLAQVDDVWCRLAVEQARAKVASTEAQLKYELIELARYGELKEKNAISQSEIDSKQAQVAELQANLAEAKAVVEQESERAIRSAIYAPFNGTVVEKYAELGSHVSLGTPIVDVVYRGQVDARLMVPESVINLVHVGRSLPIQIDPLKEKVVGTVVSITPYGPSASRTFPVRVRLDDAGGRIKVGMSVTATIATAAEHEALVVTRDAVLIRPDGSTVWVALRGEDGDTVTVQPVPVTISARMHDEYAVEPETDRGRKLLTAGASVVVEGAERLTPDQQVRIVTLEEQPAEVAKANAGVEQSAPAPSSDHTGRPAKRQES